VKPKISLSLGQREARRVRKASAVIFLTGGVGVVLTGLLTGIGPVMSWLVVADGAFAMALAVGRWRRP
jgi:uncharacterized membrane protein